eukprot:TRINITY_DN12648_c0_g5_i1.p1 TRINITY_DN12648_c0_g5~~TRINITY_DN12648_c0_g5_i1.p1  ORF type:complete len:149 (-),score=39.87 TRINITY_DN12648_c0_g5_i1:56-502(-)
MGAENSTFCSAARPNGYVDSDLLTLPSMDALTTCGAEDANKRRSMEISNMDALQKDRIHSWTSKLEEKAGSCSNVAAIIANESSTQAPSNYFADTMGDGVIKLDHFQGPILDVEQDDKVCDPFEEAPADVEGMVAADKMRTPEVVRKQ